MQESHDRYMIRALELARRGLYTTDPNPRVGCVLVNEGEIVGEGWHQRAGEPHAEILALGQAGERAKGATVYVTLEPCCHEGKTPPCSEALVKAGVARVVAAMQDPNPRVAGQGFARLEEAGIEVIVGVQEQGAEALNPGFIRRMRGGRPYVRNKLAMSLDGRTAMASGESKWITSEAARADVQRWRARSSVVMMGIGTVLADDPSMNVRLSPADLGIEGEVRQPQRVVLDPFLSLSPEARMLGLPGETLVLTAAESMDLADGLRQRGAEVAAVPMSDNQLDLNSVMDQLVEREVNEVLLETGAVLSGAMLRAGLIDELIIYMAPHLMGDQARSLFHLPGLERMEQRVALSFEDMRAIGPDWRIIAKPQ